MCVYHNFFLLFLFFLACLEKSRKRWRACLSHFDQYIRCWTGSRLCAGLAETAEGTGGLEVSRLNVGWHFLREVEIVWGVGEEWRRGWCGFEFGLGLQTGLELGFWLVSSRLE